MYVGASKSIFSSGLPGNESLESISAPRTTYISQTSGAARVTEFHLRTIREVPQVDSEDGGGEGGFETKKTEDELAGTADAKWLSG